MLFVKDGFAIEFYGNILCFHYKLRGRQPFKRSFLNVLVGIIFLSLYSSESITHGLNVTARFISIPTECLSGRYFVTSFKPRVGVYHYECIAYDISYHIPILTQTILNQSRITV